MISRCSENFEKIAKKTSLVESWYRRTAALSSQSAILLEEGLYYLSLVFSSENFENEWFWAAVSEQLRAADFDLILLTLSWCSFIM